MANITIPNLPSATALSGSEQLLGVQNGSSVAITTGQIATISPTNNLLIGSTTITGGTFGNILYNNGGFLGNLGSTGTGNVVLATSPTLTGPITIGQLIGGSQLNLSGSSSGTVSIKTAAAAGSWSLTLPTTAGTANYILQTDGSGNTAWAPYPSGSSSANPTASIGLTAVNGSATTFMRSDAAPYLSQSIAPTWTGAHIFNNTLTANSTVTLDPANAAVDISPTGTGTVTINPATLSYMDNMVIGANTAQNGTFFSCVAQYVTANQTLSCAGFTASLFTSPQVQITGGMNVDTFTVTTGPSGFTGGITTDTLSASSTVTLSPANANVVLSPTGTGLVTINPATAGTINNLSIGVTTAAAGRFTTITATGTVTLSPASANVAISPTGTGTVTISPAGALTINPTAASTINNTSIGVTTAAAGRFTTITSTSTVTLSPASANVAISPTGTGTVTISPAGALTINPTAASTINNASIGATTASTGAFTTLSASSTTTLSPASANVAISPTGTGTVAISPAGALTINPTAASTINNTSIGVTTAATGRFTGVTVTAGTASVAPILLTSGTNLTTATAGSIEYDGTVGYFTPSSSSRSVWMAEQFQILTSPYTLTSQTAVQKIFNSTTNGAITLPVGTYEFECAFFLSSLSTTSSSFGFALGGTATITQYWECLAIKPISFTSGTAFQFGFNTTANTSICPNSANTFGVAKVIGIISVTGTGTVIPQVSLGIAVAAIVNSGSYFKIRQMGSSSVTNIGNWS